VVFFRIVQILAVLLAAAPGADAQDLQALARLDVTKSVITEKLSGDVTVTLALSQAVPYRVFTLTDPMRLVVDFKELDWSNFDKERMLQSRSVSDMRVGVFRPGWSRMVLDLKRPFKVHSAEMKVQATARTALLSVLLTHTSATDFAKGAGALEAPEWATKIGTDAVQPHLRQLGDRPLVVAVDPGHGGIDPGAKRESYLEKDLVLQFARELKDTLNLSGRYQAKLTRTEDVFVSLPDRITLARQQGADVFLSIHADALAEGKATGTTVYTLSEKASNVAAEQLAIQHDRGDLLAGVDLGQQDDEIVAVLMDMARLETSNRSESLAEMLVAGIGQSVGRIRKRPHLSAGFTVLKAPDIPSVLIELGFMSNRSDLSNLLTATWREKVAMGVLLALDSWVVEDAAQAKLLRQ